MKNNKYTAWLAVVLVLALTAFAAGGQGGKGGGQSKKNVIVSVPAESTTAPVAGEVLKPKSVGYSTTSTTVTITLFVDVPAGQYQIQALDTSGVWQNVGTPQTATTPFNYGINVPLNGNVGWQIVWLGP